MNNTQKIGTIFGTSSTFQPNLKFTSDPPQEVNVQHSTTVQNQLPAIDITKNKKSIPHPYDEWVTSKIFRLISPYRAVSICLERYLDHPDDNVKSFWATNVATIKKWMSNKSRVQLMALQKCIPSGPELLETFFEGIEIGKSVEKATETEDIFSDLQKFIDAIPNRVQSLMNKTTTNGTEIEELICQMNSTSDAIISALKTIEDLHLPKVQTEGEKCQQSKTNLINSSQEDLFLKKFSIIPVKDITTDGTYTSKYLNIKLLDNHLKFLDTKQIGLQPLKMLVGEKSNFVLKFLNLDLTDLKIRGEEDPLWLERIPERKSDDDIWDIIDELEDMHLGTFQWSQIVPLS